MSGRGFFFDLMDALENNGNIHGRLIARVEELTGRNLVCYFGNPIHPGGALQDDDPDVLENLLRSLELDEYGGRLDLLINSPGGLPYAAAKMVHVCRTLSSDFRAIVFNRAMSAATLVCLGARQLLMSDTASLGPIDPQMVRGSPRGQHLVPAKVVIESFQQTVALAQRAIASGQPADPFLHVLDSLDVTAVFESLKAIEATKQIAGELLHDGLLRGAREKIPDVVAALMAEGEKELHGKHLFPELLQKTIGLPVSVVAAGAPEAAVLRELLVRVERYVAGQALARYVAVRRGSVDLRVVATGSAG